MHKRIITILCVLVLTLTIVSPVSAYISTSPSQSAPWLGYVVNAPSGLNVRAGAGDSYSILTALNNNSHAQVIGQQSNWFKVQYSISGSSGYASKDYMTYDRNYGRVTNATSGLNIRASASSSSTILAVVPNGTSLPYGFYTEDAQWFYVCWGTITGYVSASYFSV